MEKKNGYQEYKNYGRIRFLKRSARKWKEVTPRTQELIDDMLETMYDANGVGLAAPQVGILKRIVVIDVTGRGSDCTHQSPHSGNKRRADRRGRLS